VSDRILRLGIIGLGRAFMLMLPTLARDPRVRLVAAADPRREARERFAQDFGGTAYASAEDLCRDDNVDAVYIASPHQFHVGHVAAAARGGKHILVEKPLALNLPDCRKMIDAARQASVHLIVGHSHSFDTPYLKARELIASGEFGRVRMINALNFTDYLYRPRRPEELDTQQGGGAVFSQAPHQVEVVRLLAGSPATSVRAMTGMWDPARRTEGAYSALISFEGGACASLSYSGYGHFDSDELCGWIGEMGAKKDPTKYGAARRALRNITTPEAEAALKNTRAYGLTDTAGLIAADAPPAHNHFGFVVVSCERADIRPLPDAIMVYGDETQQRIPLTPPAVPRAEVIDELHSAVFANVPPLHSGEWGMETLRICLAILESSRQNREIEFDRA
jgi:phthalate 4,5-cis-dihydrodiol dehydrogenase